MKQLRKLGSAAILVVGCATLLVLPHFAATSAQQSGTEQNSSASAEPVPAYHAKAPTDELPATVAPSIYSDKLVFNAYTVAGRIKKVLYQQPCYCHCDRAVGHGSLLDCYVSQHGSHCDICQKEVFYAYEQTRKGQTPAEIRAGIVRGEWEKVDLEKYKKTYLTAQTASVK
jgi:Protein of unknown function with PCYCGC motif